MDRITLAAGRTARRWARCRGTCAGENDLSATGTFGQRLEDVRARRGRAGPWHPVAAAALAAA